MVTKNTTKEIPTVTVETKKIFQKQDACCLTDGKCSMHHIIKIGVVALTVLNTILLISILANQDKAEALKVGGDDNYKLLKQIFVSDAYKSQQKQQIEQAMQMFANPAAMQQAQQMQQQAQPQMQQQDAAAMQQAQPQMQQQAQQAPQQGQPQARPTR